MPDDAIAVAGRCGMFVPACSYPHNFLYLRDGPTRTPIGNAHVPIPGVPGPGSWLDRMSRKGPVKPRARYSPSRGYPQAIPT
ncbi:hypothetical protein SM007_04810 [Streptomyces avermitilis]|nr:hypothetical protein SM007_04810 [Streptomyces avermitilis]